MFIEILLKILSVFLLVGMGFASSKTHLLPEDSLKTLNSFVLNVAVPALVLQSMQRDDISASSNGDMFWSFVAFAIITVFILVVSTLVLRPAKSIPEDEKAIYTIQMAFTNCGFMGYPLVTFIFGKYSLFLAILMNIVFTLLIYSVGVFLLVHKRGEKMGIMKLLGQMLTMPFMSSIVGIVIFATGFHFPNFIDDSLELMAGTLSPVAMFVVGINLSKTKLANIFKLRNLVLCVLSLVVVPALALGVDMLLPVSKDVLITHVFLMAMPSPAITTVLCARYNKNALLASEGVASTTFLSLFTLSAWAFLLTGLFG